MRTSISGTVWLSELLCTPTCSNKRGSTVLTYELNYMST